MPEEDKNPGLHLLQPGSGRSPLFTLIFCLFCLLVERDSRLVGMFQSHMKSFVRSQCFLDRVSSPNITVNNLLAKVSNFYSNTQRDFELCDITANNQ